MTRNDRDRMADVIHDVLSDICCQAEDATPDRVLCFEVAEALVAEGFGDVLAPEVGYVPGGAA